MAASNKGPRKLALPPNVTSLVHGPIYGNAKAVKALEHFMHEDQSIWGGTRLAILLETFYKQGLKDGRAEVIDNFNDLSSKLEYKNPGKPRKKKSPAKAPARKRSSTRKGQRKKKK